jgi:tetratricopeptide (TPR) repeat protein
MLLALAYQFGGKPRLALPAAERAFRVALDVYRGDSRHARVIEGRAVLGRALHDAGEYERGIEELTRALDDASAVFGTTSMMVGFFAGNLAKDQIEAGDIAPALQNIERSLRVLDGQVDRDSYTYGAALHTRGAALLAARRIGEALPVLTTSQATLEHALGPSHERTYAAQLDLGLALGYAGKADQARQAVSAVVEARRAGRKASIWAALSALGILERLDGNYDEALRMQGDALRSIPDDPKAKRVRMPVLTEIGLGHLERGGYDEAAASLGEALALLAASQRSVTPQRADALIGLGRARMGQGRALEALPLLEEADRFWRASDAHNRWAGEAALWLGRCYSSLGRGREARRALSRARTILSRSPIPTDGRLLQLARRG